MIRTEKVIDSNDFDALVRNTYGKPYTLQQQDGCMERGRVNISVPETPFDYENDILPEGVNGEEMGVSFKSWLARDPKEWKTIPSYGYEVVLFWDRNFYPHISMVINDLYSKGLLPEGEYVIDIDW